MDSPNRQNNMLSSFDLFDSRFHKLETQLKPWRQTSLSQDRCLNGTLPWTDRQTSIRNQFRVKVLPVSISDRPICRYISVEADISVIGRYIGFADNKNPYRYRLSASADKKANIGNLTDIKIYYLFSWFSP